MKTEPNNNIISCEATPAPVDKNDSTSFDEFVKWYRQWDASAHARRPVDTDVLGKMLQLRDHCDKSERENEQTYIRDAEE